MYILYKAYNSESCASPWSNRTSWDSWVHYTQVLHVFHVDSYYDVHAHISVLLHLSAYSDKDKLWLSAQTCMNQDKRCGILLANSLSLCWRYTEQVQLEKESPRITRFQFVL
jgi:hypothetical protein